MFTRKEMLVNTVWAAIAWTGISIGTRMAHQDTLGLEAYLEWAKASWVQLSPWWGHALVILSVFNLWWIFRGILKKKEDGADARIPVIARNIMLLTPATPEDSERLTFYLLALLCKGHKTERILRVLRSLEKNDPPSRSWNSE